MSNIRTLPSRTFFFKNLFYQNYRGRVTNIRIAQIRGVRLRPVNELHTIALARTHTQQYLFRCAIIANAKLYVMSQLHVNTSVVFLQLIHLQVLVKLSFHSQKSIIYV